jgi:hypothetical protein
MASIEIQNIYDKITELETKLNAVFNIINDKVDNMKKNNKELQDKQIKFLEENLPPII